MYGSRYMQFQPPWCSARPLCLQVSADMAHALHPNYSDKHDPDHQPRLHEGLVLKHNANQRYATNSVSAALFREVGGRYWSCMRRMAGVVTWAQATPCLPCHESMREVEA
jgi:hypothetical protein